MKTLEQLVQSTGAANTPDRPKPSRLLLEPAGARIVAEMVLTELDERRITSAGSRGHAGLLAVAAITLASALRKGPKVQGYWQREKPKEHGVSQALEGHPPQAGQRTALLLPAASSGDEALAMVDEVRRTGAKVTLVMVIMERGDEARRSVTGAGYRYLALHST